MFFIKVTKRDKNNKPITWDTIESYVNKGNALNSKGQRTITSGQTGQEIPFVREDGSVNEAAWITLKSQPNKLASLRNTVLNMSLNKAANLDF